MKNTKPKLTIDDLKLPCAFDIENSPNIEKAIKEILIRLGIDPIIKKSGKYSLKPAITLVVAADILSKKFSIYECDIKAKRENWVDAVTIYCPLPFVREWSHVLSDRPRQEGLDYHSALYGSQTKPSKFKVGDRISRNGIVYEIIHKNKINKEIAILESGMPNFFENIKNVSEEELENNFIPVYGSPNTQVKKFCNAVESLLDDDHTQYKLETRKKPVCPHNNVRVIPMIYTSFKQCADCGEDLGE